MNTHETEVQLVLKKEGSSSEEFRKVATDAQKLEVNLFLHFDVVSKLCTCR